jgi:uncharacterized protein
MFPLSRETSIRLDRDGTFWHEGARVEHPGLARAFATWLDVDPETGRYILKNDINWAYIAVEDAPLLVRGVTDSLELTLSDGTREPLDPATLRLDEDDVPYCDVRGGKLPARFLPGAAFALLELPAIDVAAIRRVPRGQGAARARPSITPIESS